MASLWPIVVSVVYFGIFFILIMLLTYRVQRKDGNSFWMAVWRAKAPYFQIILHLFDTSTNYGILVEWYIMDLTVLFLISLSFIIIHRFMSMIIGYINAKSTDKGLICFDSFLGLLDMYVIRTFYIFMKDRVNEPTLKQKMIQLTQTVIQTLPQFILQCIFIFNTESMDYFVLISMFSSLLNITNKYIWIDQECVQQSAKNANFRCAVCCSQRPKTTKSQTKKESLSPPSSAKEPVSFGDHEMIAMELESNKCICVNQWYFGRVIWRICYVAVRYVILCLIWSITSINEPIFGFFLLISWLIWFILAIVDIYFDDGFIDFERFLFSMSFSIISLIASPANQSFVWAFVHVIEVSVALSVISVYSSSNLLIVCLIIVAWFALIIDAICYFVLLYFGLFKDDIRYRLAHSKWIEMVKNMDDKKRNGELYIDNYTNDKGQLLYVYFLTMFAHQKLKNEQTWLTKADNSDNDVLVKDIFESLHAVYMQLDEIDEKRMFLQMIWCSILQDGECFIETEQEWLDAVGQKTVRMITTSNKRRSSYFEQKALNQISDLINDIGAGMYVGTPFDKKVSLLKFCLTVGPDIEKMDQNKPIIANLMKME